MKFNVEKSNMINMYILEKIDAGSESLSASVAEAFGISTNTVHSYLRKLQEQNIIPMIHSVKIAKMTENLIELNVMHCCQNPTLNPMQIPLAIEKYLPEIRPDFSKCRRIEVYDSKMQIFR